MILEDTGPYASGLIFVLLIIIRNVSEIKKSSNSQALPPWIVPAILFVLVFMPIIFLTIIIFATFRHFIKIILKIRHGSKFNGLLNGLDSAQIIGEKPHHLINVLVMFRFMKQTSPQVFYEKIKQVVLNGKKYTKFSSKLYSFCGYTYMLKEPNMVYDCIREIKIVGDQKDKISKSEFLKLLNESCNLDLPEDNTVPWEIIVGKQKVDWKDDGYDYYPLVFRCEHAIADGVTLTEIMVDMFSDKKSYEIEVKEKRDKYYVLRCMENFVIGLRLFMLFPAFFVSTFLIQAKDDNILGGPKLSKDISFLMYIEESPGYVEKIKAIKNTIPGISFSDVVLAAFSASFNDYFMKKYVKIEYISTLIPVLPGSSNLRSLVPEQVQTLDNNIHNKFSVVMMNIPIFVGYESGSINDFNRRLRLIKEQGDVLRHSLDCQMTTLIAKAICAYLPKKIYEWILNSTGCTSSFTILPGPPKVHCWQNSAVISDIVGFGNNVLGIGITVTINTYDGRLHIGVHADKSLMSCEEDVREIADNIPKHIDALYKHVDFINVND